MSSTDTPAEGEIRVLRLADLDRSLQTRSEIRRDAVAEYATQIGKNERFPRPIVYEHDGRLFLVSGHHRVGAYELRNYTELECEVIQGDPIAAVTAGIKANVEQRSERLTRADRHHTILLLLRLDRSLSNYAIAEICGVVEGTVRNCREKLPTAQITQSRVGRDGRTRRVPDRPAEGDAVQPQVTASQGETSKTDKLSVVESPVEQPPEPKSITMIRIGESTAVSDEADLQAEAIGDSVSPFGLPPTAVHVTDQVDGADTAEPDDHEVAQQAPTESTSNATTNLQPPRKLVFESFSGRMVTQEIKECYRELGAFCRAFHKAEKDLGQSAPQLGDAIEKCYEILRQEHKPYLPVAEF